MGMQAAVSLTCGPAGLSWAEACGAISPNSPFGPLSGSHTPVHLCASSPPESNASHPKPSVLPHAQMLATACRAPAPPFPLLPGNVYGIGCVLLRVSRRRAPTRRRAGVVRCGLLPVDPWAPAMDSQSVASQLFAVSLFPYLGFLYFMTRSKTAPGLTLFGFYFLLAFVGATIPAGIYAKVHYGTSLSNVDWLHGTAESLLTLTNLFIVLGLRGALRNLKDTKEGNSEASQDNKEKGSI